MSEDLPEYIGPYRIQSKLGQGGMGAVFRAAHETLDRPAAVKLLPPDMAGNPEYVSRFLREARTIATLNHPHVVHVYDAGAFEGKYFIAMELIEGMSLQDYCVEKQLVDEKEAVRLLHQAALGLSVAHAKGLIHRDIKPENLLLDQERNLHIVDFGLVRESSSQTQLTVAGACLGTPMYMSPEQADGARVDTRSDIYSLGATFYRAVSGRPPFVAPTVVSLLFKHKFEAPPDPRQFQPGLSENLVQLLFTMLAKVPQNRPHDGQALVELIEKLMRGETVPPAPPFREALEATVIRPSGEYVGAEAQASVVGDESTERLHRLRRITVAAGVALVLVVATTWFCLRPGGGDAKSTREPAPGGTGWRQLMEAAKKLETGGDLELALAMYEQALTKSGNDEELARKVKTLKEELAVTKAERGYANYIKAGDLESARGDFPAARANYNLAQRLKPDSREAVAKVKKASAQIAMQDAEKARAAGDMATARQEYLRAIQYCPEMSDEINRRLSGLDK